MAHIEGCKHALDITIPADAVAAESEKVLDKVQQKAQLKGFRPGKAPRGHVKALYRADIQREVLENLIPKFIDQACEKEGLRMVSQPEVKDLHFHEGEAAHFKAEFEVSPEFELGEYRGLTVAYAEPAVTDSDIDTRLNEIRESRAELVNVDPRPAAEGDHCLVSLESISGVEGAPMKQDDINIEIGGKETIKEFSEILAGAMPGDVRETEITYPDDYAAERLAGKTVRFKIELKTIRIKELPELNDDFAKDLGDFQTLDEVREEVRKAISREREYVAQTEAKNSLIDSLVDAHEFPVPEAYVERQVEINLENQLRNFAAQGMDVSKIRLDWEKIKATQSDKARRDVRASLILEKVADTESIHTSQDELDNEVNRIARQQREPVAAVRLKMEKDGTLGRIASRIRTEKTLNLLFEHAVKQAPAPVAE
ncbi:MAG TPA: trigger factor [Bryobacteraceae bacterium]|nr:trigger factor [Bryobacteraceae bacterium]HPT28236.1 trigger factor [Bryobacteraceae bacterium]